MTKFIYPKTAGSNHGIGEIGVKIRELCPFVLF